MAKKRLSDLYELHIHSNTYHSENYVTDTYVDTRFHDSIWQDAVISFYDPNDGLPSEPSFRDRYIASDSGNDWTKNYIYEWNQEIWVEIEPQRLFTLFVEDEDRNYTYYDGSWVVTENTYVHNDISEIQGGNESERYHLQLSAYDNLKNQDQEVYTDSNVDFNDISAANNVDISGTLDTDGDVTFNNNVDFTDSDSDLTVEPTTTFNNPVTVNDNVDITGTLDVGSAATFDSTVDINGELTVTNEGSFTDLTISSPSNIYDSLNHDDFNDYDAQDHRQWENSIDQDIHDDNITSSSITQHEGNITHNNVDGIQGSSEGYHLQQSAYDNLKNQDQEVYSTSLPNFEQITLDTSPTESNEVARKDYVDGLFQEGMYWQPAVIDFYDFSSDEPSASDGDRYISTTTTSTSAFIENYIYEYSADTDDWIEYEPERGWTVLVESDERLHYYKEDTDEWIKLANFMYHNNLQGIQGGGSDEYYHLQQSAYDNLKNQNQSVETTSSPTFDDLSITNPNNIYDLSHDSFADYEATEHRQWENSISENIHDDNITSSSVTQHEGDIDHNSLSGINGSSDGYHLTSDEHGYLSGQDQSVETTDSVTFDDVSITNPNNIYDLSHDNFADFDSDEHIDWTVTGSQTIHDDRISSSSVTQHEGDIDHDALTNFVSNEHINHTNVSISAGTGLSGGGDISSDRTINLDANIDDINDVDASSPTDEYVLAYNSGTGNWEPTDIDEISSGSVDHGGLNGLGDDDHTQYLLADGSRDLDGDLTVTGDISIETDSALLTNRAGDNNHGVAQGDGDSGYTGIDGLDIFGYSGVNIYGTDSDHTIAEFNDNGNVNIPNGDMSVSGKTTSDDGFETGDFEIKYNSNSESLDFNWIA